MGVLDFFRPLRVQPHEWRPVQSVCGWVMRRMLNGEWQERAITEAEGRELEEDYFYFNTPP